jgi:NADPH:quinone reductase-like Zn-dependent oxidoreductase
MVQDSYGGADVMQLRNIDKPQIGEDEVLIRVRAAGVNPADWAIMSGLPYIARPVYGLRKPKVSVRGTDVSGVVEAVGANVTRFQPGDEVFGASHGSYAEYAAAAEHTLALKPANLTFEQAAAVPMAGLVALQAIRDHGHVEAGQRVLVNGASGGIGTFAVQIAKALGAEVTGVTSTRNVELVRSIGADHVIDYTHEDFTRGERRYDVILDNVLNHRPRTTTRALAPGGVFMPNSVGNTGGMFAGLLRMAGAVPLGLGSTSVKFVNCIVDRGNLEALSGLLESGDVKVVIDRVYPLAQAGEAVAHMLGHHARGKVVITV